MKSMTKDCVCMRNGKVSHNRDFGDKGIVSVYAVDLFSFNFNNKSAVVSNPTPPGMGELWPTCI